VQTSPEVFAVAGDHTRTVSIVAPTSGGLMGFVKKTETCLGCRSPLPPAKKGSKQSVPTLEGFAHSH
jgi:DNA polymerase delta subunit 1